MHGGMSLDTKAGDLELVAKSDLIVIHVVDHGKATKLTSATGRGTVYDSSEKTEAPPVLAGDRVEAKGTWKVARGQQGLGQGRVERQAGRYLPLFVGLTVFAETGTTP
ncbi:MAG: hypothetical protein ABIN08_08855 [Caldimonas sp.]